MHMIDRRRVQSSFGKQARSYEKHALVQKRVISMFIALLQDAGLSPGACLDVGSGSGMLLQTLRHIYPQMSAIGVDLSPGMTRVARDKLAAYANIGILAADAEYLPFPDAHFDLVVSTSTFQWLHDLHTAFSEVFRVLKPGGAFAFSLFGEHTLHELRSSYRMALSATGTAKSDHTHIFFPVEKVSSSLEEAKFRACRIHSEFETETHRDVPDLLRSLKGIGAGNASPLTNRGLGSRSVMLEMMNRYRLAYGDVHGVPATYEVIYGFGTKPR